MTEVYYKSDVPYSNLEARVRRLSQKYPGAWKEGGSMNVVNVVSVLQEEGVKCYAAQRVQPAAVWSYLYRYANDDTPVIVSVRWDDGIVHGIVCVYVYKKDQHCIFLDPTYGLVEIPGPKLPRYTVENPILLNADDTPVIDNEGQLSGWVIVTRR
jgi:hypothetical protein